MEEQVEARPNIDNMKGLLTEQLIDALRGVDYDEAGRALALVDQYRVDITFIDAAAEGFLDG